MNNKEQTMTTVTLQLTAEQHQLLKSVLTAAILNDKTNNYTELGQARLLGIKEQL